MAAAGRGVAAAYRAVTVSGVVRPPGDKSISHRVLMLAALARGRSELRGLLTGDDVKSTARVLRQLGANISRIQESGVGVSSSRLLAPGSRLHCGNSGTTARLMLGILAGQKFVATLTGDASLRRRPMRRVTEPLKAMGADIKESGDGLPVTIRGGTLRGLTYKSPVASAQVKSALLLAGLTGNVPVTIEEPYRSRDHTERLFAYLGFGIHERNGDIVFEPPVHPAARPPLDLTVPGDISSAAFLIGAAILADAGELLVENVGVNPTRTGFLVVLERMGARVERINLRDEAGEPVADLIARPANLAGTAVTAAEIPTLVDEVPILAVLASRASGETVFREVGELRVKESNRLELMAANLRAVGVRAEARGNDLHVEGTTRAPRGRVETASDHRLAMAFAVLGTVNGAAVKLSEKKSVAISYPGFFTDLKRIRADVQP
ncbi:MAG TPA: 3-phosphoshikimate 1-carboxyvinyltransferase [Gemmatimonadales bacterium]|nr:3-phosphoshikimate 1-carboxyvinyltransferase [Gemmatimonadales bacterium]